MSRFYNFSIIMQWIALQFIDTGQSLAGYLVDLCGYLPVPFPYIGERTIGIHLPSPDAVGSKIFPFMEIMMVRAPFSKRTVHSNELRH